MSLTFGQNVRGQLGLGLTALLFGRAAAIPQTASIPTTTSSPPTVTPFLFANRCVSSWYSYSSASESIYALGSSSISTGFLPTYVHKECCYASINSTVPMTTLCDGYPRALAFPKTDYTTSTITELNYTQYSTLYPTHTEVVPTCKVTGSACSSAWDAYDTTLASLKSARDDRSYDYRANAMPPTGCSSPIHVCPTATACSVAADEVTMYYWPVTTVNGDFCARNGTTLTPTPTGNGPNTVRSGDMVFTSPSVYLKGGSAYAWYVTSRRGLTTWGLPCGATTAPFTFSFPPAALSTYNPHTKEVLYSLDYLDLATPRYEAYTRACPRRYGCSSFTDIVSDFTPYMAMPLEARTLKPEWNACTQGGFYPTLIPLGVDSKTTSTSPAVKTGVGELAANGGVKNGKAKGGKEKFVEEVYVVVIEGVKGHRVEDHEESVQKELREAMRE